MLSGEFAAAGAAQVPLVRATTERVAKGVQLTRAGPRRAVLLHGRHRGLQVPGSLPGTEATSRSLYAGRHPFSQGSVASQHAPAQVLGPPRGPEPPSSVANTPSLNLNTTIFRRNKRTTTLYIINTRDSYLTRFKC